VTVIVDVAVDDAPALSVTFSVIVYVPSVPYVWLERQVPAVSLTVPVEEEPSPHVIVHVCVSAVPASVKEPLNE
jgi:hypothetical protein